MTTENGRTVVKHWLQDVGSTFGMCNDLHEWDLSWEHFYQGRATMKRVVSFGSALSPWQTVNYVEGPSIGKFEGDRFDPRTWRRAARRVAAFSDEMIRAIIHTGEFTDAAAERAIGNIMIKRRDKILKTYLPAVNPIVDLHLSPSGEFTFNNAAVAADVASGPKTYAVEWRRFDNATGLTTDLGVTRGSATMISAPPALPSAPGTYVRAEIAAIGGPESWAKAAHTYFFREADGWKLVGFERVPVDKPSGTQTAKRRTTNHCGTCRSGWNGGAWRTR